MDDIGIGEQIRRGIEGELQAVMPPRRTGESAAPAEVHFSIGNALHRLGRDPDAREAWETCSRLFPEYPLVHNNLAVLYASEGRTADALAALDRAAALGMRIDPAMRSDIAKAGPPQAP